MAKWQRVAVSRRAAEFLRSVIIAGMFVGMPITTSSSETNALADLKELLPVWDYAITLRTGAGYNDNVLLTHQPFQRSAFLSAALEAVAWRLPINGPEVQFTAMGDYLRYQPHEFVDDEQSALAQAQVKKDFASHWQVSFSGEWTYQSSVVDATTVNVNAPGNATKIEGPSYEVTPALRRYLGDRVWAEASVPLGWQFYGTNVGDYIEIAPSATLGGNYGHESEWTVGYTFSHSDYDNRVALFLDGSDTLPPIPLELSTHSVEAVLRHSWDNQRRWSTTTRLTWRHNRDNGPGYLDYAQWQGSQEARYRAESWEVFLRGRISYRDYNPERQLTFHRRTDVGVRVGAEKRLAKWLKAEIGYEYELTSSDEPTTDYSINKISGGMVWEF